MLQVVVGVCLRVVLSLRDHTTQISIYMMDRSGGVTVVQQYMGNFLR